MTPRRWLYVFLIALCALRLAIIGLYELSPDESYYFLWSQHPALSYYSKGPGVAATIWLSSHLFGASEFGIRFFSPLLSLGTSLLMFHFARRLYGESVAVWATIALSCIPIFQAGGLLMTIDPLSMFFWMAALVTCWRALEECPRFSWWWPATGALIGLGFLCKWTNAIQLLSIILLLLLTPRHRRELRRAGFWSMLGTFVLFTIPPVVWNAQNGWITLSHLSARGGLEKAFTIDLGEFFSFLGTQFGVYSPVIYAACLAALWLGGQKARVHFKPRFLLAFAVPLLALYFFLSLREAGEPNWTAPAMLSLGLLAVAIFHELAATKKWIAPTAIAGLALGIFISFFSIDVDALRQCGIPLPYSLDPSTRLRGWRTTAEQVDDFRHTFEAENGPVFLIGNKYQTSASLGFYLRDQRREAPGHPAVYIPESQMWENQFSFWPRYDEMTDVSELARAYVASPEADPERRALIAAALEAWPKDDAAPSAKTSDARRTLVRELHRAMPDLPLDESYVEEEGISIFQGKNALYVTDREEDKAPSTIKSGFEKVEMVRCIDVLRRGLTVRQIRIFACYNYRGMSL